MLSNIVKRGVKSARYNTPKIIRENTRNFSETPRKGFLGMALINQNSTGVVRVFGKYSRMMSPGLHFYIPFVHRINEISNRMQESRFDMSSMTKDNAFVHLEIAIQLVIPPERSADAFFKLSNPSTQLTSFVDNYIRSVVPKMTLTELFRQREELSHGIEESVGEIMRKNGFELERIQILGITPSKQVLDAMNTVLASERLLAASINEAEAAKVKMVKAAEADAERRILQGKGTAGQRIEIMKGYEEGVHEMSQQLGLTSKDILDFLTRIQELDTFERIGESQNAKTIFLDTSSAKDKSTLFMKANQV